jgi:CubicO group peptidase (beta-lactamase class C family)
LTRIDKRFARYVDEGLLPGYLAVVTRHGRVAHIASAGHRDVEAGLPVEQDTIWRIFSMSKPITSVAAMMLVEEGAIDLNDPISAWLPEFAEPRVYVKGSALRPVTEPATEPIRLWHLLTHTSGLTYGFHHTHPVDAIYRAAGYEWGAPAGLDLASVSQAWAGLPLMFQPGSEWNYSVSTDVLGRLIEVVSGQPLDTFFAERILGPLGMTDTAFYYQGDDPSRVAALYVPTPGTNKAVRNAAFSATATQRPSYLSGGGGLVSTAADYHRFTQMLLRGGELDGVRLLSARTVRFMASNHLPGNADLEEFGRPLFAETPFDGHGFGLGFSVLMDPIAAKTLSSAGEIAWGGAASTAFWVDPDEDVTALFFTQLLPSNTHPIRQQLRQLVYQALVE